MINKNIIKQLYSYIGFIWLLFMLAFPSDFQTVKYASMIMLLIFSMADFVLNQKTIHRNIIIGTTVWISYFLFSLSLGISRGYTIDFPLINIYFITPLVAVLLSTIIDTSEKLMKTNKYLIIITFIIVIIDFVYILDRMSLISIPFDFQTSIFGSVFVTDSKLEFRITNQSSLIFLLPYCTSLYMTNGINSKKEKIVLATTILLGLIITIMSGRRAFQAVVFLAFILTPMYKTISKNNQRFNLAGYLKKGMVLILLLPIVGYLLIAVIEKLLGIENVISSFWNTFLSAFDFTSGSGEIRADQSSALLSGWGDSPLIGHGINSFDKNLIRSHGTPWSYEMVYIALLFQTGMLGALLFFFISVFIIIRNLKKSYLLKGVYASYYISISTAFTSFLIAGSSNPMVYYVWAWAIALVSYQNFSVNNGEEIALREVIEHEKN